MKQLLQSWTGLDWTELQRQQVLETAASFESQSVFNKPNRAFWTISDVPNIINNNLLVVLIIVVSYAGWLDQLWSSSVWIV